MAVRRGQPSPKLTLLGALLLATTLSACAYGFTPGRVRPGLDTVSVPFFENRSREPDAELVLTEAIVQGIIDDRTLKVVDGQYADAEIRGVLQRYEFIESFYSADDRQADEQKIRIICQVTMIDRKTQDPIVGPRTVSGEGTYLLADGAEGEESARQIATQEIVEGILNMVIEEW